MAPRVLPPTVFTSRRTGEIIAERFVGDRPRIEVLNDDFAKVYAQLAKLSDGVLGTLSSDLSEHRWIATFVHDRDPAMTWLYDHVTRKSRILFHPYPDLDPADFAPMTPIALNARDGLPLHGFLTLPVRVEREPRPLVILVQGGPWLHDTWDYNPQVQLLANRGYGVLQGTTVNTVRHYHALGILEAPERKYNGYKQYRVRHLVRLIRVRRLAELGLPLSLVAETDPATDTTAELQRVDAEMRAAIERFDAARADIAAILRESAPIDSPRGFESFAARLSEADRSMIHIYSRLVDEQEMSRLKRIVMRELDTISDEFDTLSPDADESTRQRVAERITDGGANWRSADAALLSDEAVHGCRRMHVIHQTLSAALVELSSSAQVDVLRRASTVVRRPPLDEPRVKGNRVDVDIALALALASGIARDRVRVIGHEGVVATG